MQSSNDLKIIVTKCYKFDNNLRLPSIVDISNEK